MRLFTTREDKALVAEVRAMRIAANPDHRRPNPIKVRLMSRGQTYHTEASLYRTVAAHRALAREIN
jgi:hypothetical protein